MRPNYYNMYNNYYKTNKINYRNINEFKSEEIITLNQAIEIIKNSIKEEKEDEIFYDILISKAPSEKEKNIIKSIRNDERKHNKILKELYQEFTGETVKETNIDKNPAINLDYKSGLEKALFGELEAVAKYRKIMGAMPNKKSYTLLMSIMTDELRHASKYNFLINNAR